MPLNLERAVLELATDTAKFNLELDQAKARVVALEGQFVAAKDKAAQFDRQLDSTAKGTGLLSSGLSKLGAVLSVAAIGAAAKQFADFAGNLTDLSSKTGIGTTELQKLGYAAKMNGVELETLTGGVTKLGRTLIEGDKSAVKALGTLGLKLDDVRKMAPDEAFTAVADAIAKIPNPMEQAALAMTLFGKSGAELLPAMKGNLTETAAAAERLGIVLDEGTVAAGDNLGDTLDTLQLVGTAFIGKVLAPMVPAIVAVVGWLTKTGGVVDTLRYGVDYLGIALGRSIAKFYEWGAAVFRTAAGIADKLPGFMTGWSGSALRAEEKTLIEQSRWWTDAANAQQLQVQQAQAAEYATKKQTQAVAGLRGEYGKAAKDVKDAYTEFDRYLDRIQSAGEDLARERYYTAGPDWVMPRAGLQAPSGFEGGSDILDPAVQQALQFQTWAGGNWGLPGKPTKKGAGWGDFGVGALGSFSDLFVRAFTGGGGVSGAMSAFATQSTSGAIGKVLTDATKGISGTLGKVLGSVIPGVGGLIGSGVGWLVGKLFGPSKEDIANQNATKQIEEVQAGLLQTYGTLENIAKAGGDAGKELVAAWGSKGQAGLAQFNSKLGDFNAAIERNKKLIAELGAMKPGERLSQAVRDQIASGTLPDDVKAALGEFFKGQTSNLAGAVKAYVESGGAGQIAQKGAVVSAQQLQAQGLSLSQIAEILGPTFATLAGKGMGGSWSDLIATVMRPEVAPLAEQADQLGIIAGSLDNLGQMDPGTFDDLSSALLVNRKALLDQGVMDDAANRIEQKSLQRIWEVATDYGYAVDAQTQLLIDQAKDQGLIGDAFWTSEDQLKLAMQGQIDALRDNTAALRGQPSPSSGGGAPSGGGSRSGPSPTEDHQSAPDEGTHGYYWNGEAMVPYHAGGVVRAHAGMLIGGAALAADEIPIIAQAGEGLLSRHVGMPALGALALSALNRGDVPGGGAASPPVSVSISIHAIDSQDVQRFFEKRGLRSMGDAIRVNGGQQNDYLRKVLRQLVRD